MEQLSAEIKELQLLLSTAIQDGRWSAAYDLEVEIDEKQEQLIRLKAATIK